MALLILIAASTKRVAILFTSFLTLLPITFLCSPYLLSGFLSVLLHLNLISSHHEQILFSGCIVDAVVGFTLNSLYKTFRAKFSFDTLASFNCSKRPSLSAVRAKTLSTATFLQTGSKFLCNFSSSCLESCCESVIYIHTGTAASLNNCRTHSWTSALESDDFTLPVTRLLASPTTIPTASRIWRPLLPRQPSTYVLWTNTSRLAPWTSEPPCFSRRLLIAPWKQEHIENISISIEACQNTR